METKVRENGQIVIPASLRRRLGIRSGDKLRADVRNGNIVLTPQAKTQPKSRLIKDPLTGFPVLDSGKDSPVLTNEMVREMLADFP